MQLDRAAGLKAMDSNGKSDPYVKLSLCGKQHKSKVVSKTLNPRWDESFIFEGTLRELTAEPMQMKVYDHDYIGRNDFLGEASVDLRPMRRSQQYDAEVRLSTQGYVYLRFS